MTERRRLMADRFAWVWAVVTKIANEPGLSRGQLADHFHVCERQIQMDLSIIRADMRLPLIRRQGYRFVDEGAAANREALLIGTVGRGAA